MATVRISRELIESAMQSRPVRAGCAAVADRKAGNARSIAASEAPEVEITREDGTRPKGRPVSRIYSSDVDGEFGTSRTEQRRILGRAAQS